MKDFSISFDSKFLKEALKQFKNIVSIRFISELKPFIITSEEKKQLIQLILPTRNY
jgi:DNA polymerase III sliding clamp (beta) subunit (PCNA family)